MAHEGGGVLLYLAQEGRGIGLTNELRAYMLQDGGLDTVDANHHLGFANDERDYWAAAAMLRQVGVDHGCLLTNNPTKIAQLERYGIEVAGRVPHMFAANAHNRGYLLTKAERSGHMLPVDDLQPPKTGANGAASMWSDTVLGAGGSGMTRRPWDARRSFHRPDRGFSPVSGADGCRGDPREKLSRLRLLDRATAQPVLVAVLWPAG